jgi:uncharacterized protein (DUF58 family)
VHRALKLWLAGIIVLSIVVPSTAGLLIAFGVASLVAVLGLWTWLVRRSLKVEVDLPERLVQGEVASMRVVVANHSRLPAPRVRVEIKLPPGRLLPGETVLEVSLPGRSSITREAEVSAYVRGHWSSPPVRVEVADPWGVWLRSTNAPAPPTVVVLPSLVPVRRLDLPAISPLAEVPDTRSLTTDPAAIVGVRPYEPGDPLRSIHWPATAATGVLVRRETERAWARDLVVILDLDHDTWDRFDDQPLEVAVSTAASVLTHAVLAVRQPAGLVASMPDPLGDEAWTDPANRASQPAARFQVGASRAHLDAMLVHLAAVVRHRGVPLWELLLREAGTRTPGTTLAIITATPDSRVLDAIATVRRSGLAPMLLEVSRPDADAPVRRSSARRRLPRYLVSTAEPIGSTHL